MNISDAHSQADYNQLAAEAKKIYSKIQSQYESTHKGEYLSIEVESGDMYLGATSLESAKKAHLAHPDKMSYTFRVGYDAAITLATPFFYIPNHA